MSERCECDECKQGIDDEVPSSIPHYHKNEKGHWVKCYHECRSIVSQPSFWILTTLTFPIEHAIWEYGPAAIYDLFRWMMEHVM